VSGRSIWNGARGLVGSHKLSYSPGIADPTIAPLMCRAWLQCQNDGVRENGMNWVGIVVALVCLYLAFRVAAFMVKLLLLAAVLCGLYAFFAPMLGMPSPFG